MSKERFTFFWHGPFSQWEYSEFMDEEGITYNTAEQYMMYQKAKLFGDELIARRIIKSKSPREQKELGKQVKGFKESTWRKHRIHIVYEGNLLKYRQSPKLREMLFKTDGTTLVNASPYDVTCGIGLHETDPYCRDRKKWNGENLLGEILTRVRVDLMKEFIHIG